MEPGRACERARVHNLLTLRLRRHRRDMRRSRRRGRRRFGRRRGRLKTRLRLVAARGDLPTLTLLDLRPHGADLLDDRFRGEFGCRLRRVRSGSGRVETLILRHETSSKMPNGRFRPEVTSGPVYECEAATGWKFGHTPILPD